MRPPTLPYHTSGILSSARRGGLYLPCRTSAPPNRRMGELAACSRLLELENLRERFAWCGEYDGDRVSCQSAMVTGDKLKLHFCSYNASTARCRAQREGWSCQPPSIPPPPPARGVAPACSAGQQPHARTVLFELVPAFHGSTAVQTLLMSSGGVADLCRARTWECEGGKLHLTQGGALPSEFSEQEWAPRSQRLAWLNLTAKLSLYARFWQLERPLLLVKDAGFLLPESPLVDALEWIRLAESVPLRMREAGIRRLSTAYLLVWRPVCLARLSANSANGTLTSSSFRELLLLEKQVEWHRHVSARDGNILVVSFADLLWEPALTSARLSAFLPCSAPFDAEYAPRAGVDVFPENQWKVRSSISSYGESHPSFRFDYSTKKRRCIAVPAFSAQHDTFGCTNTCRYAGDGVCDDGGVGSEFAACQDHGKDGTDCHDCSKRTIADVQHRLATALSYLRQHSRLPVVPSSPPAPAPIRFRTPQPPLASPPLPVDPPLPPSSQPAAVSSTQLAPEGVGRAPGLEGWMVRTALFAPLPFVSCAVLAMVACVGLFWLRGCRRAPLNHSPLLSPRSGPRIPTRRARCELDDT